MKITAEHRFHDRAQDFTGPEIQILREAAYQLDRVPIQHQARVRSWLSIRGIKLGAGAQAEAR